MPNSKAQPSLPPPFVNSTRCLEVYMLADEDDTRAMVQTNKPVVDAAPAPARWHDMLIDGGGSVEGEMLDATMPPGRLRSRRRGCLETSAERHLQAISAENLRRRWSVSIIRATIDDG